jgi:acyl carrier protein
MTEQQIRDKVCEIMSVVLKRTVTVNENVIRQQEGGWDSLKHIEIIFNLEGAFNIQFSEEEMLALDSLNKIVEIVLDHHES